MGKKQLEDLEVDGSNYIEDLEWNRFRLYSSEIMEVMKDCKMWRLRPELLPRNCITENKIT